MTIDPVITLNAPITVFAIGVGVVLIQNSIKKNRKQSELNEIKFDALLHALFYSLNGKGDEVRQEYEKKKAELMDEKNFTNT